MTSGAASLLALDTSAAVPLLVADHAAHTAVSRWGAGRVLHLAGRARDTHERVGAPVLVIS